MLTISVIYFLMLHLNSKKKFSSARLHFIEKYCLDVFQFVISDGIHPAEIASKY